VLSLFLKPLVFSAEISKQIYALQTEISWNINNATASALEPKCVLAAMEPRNEPRIDDIEYPSRGKAGGLKDVLKWNEDGAVAAFHVRL
jgi:hypothetical protein